MLSEQERTEIFRLCLDEIEQGRLTLEQCVSRYPNIPNLRRMLEVTETSRHMPLPVMSSARTQELHNRLMAQMRQQKRKPIATTHVWFRLATVLAACLVFIFVSGVGVLIAADYTVPGDAFYWIKRSAEQVRISAANTQSRPTILANIAQVRLGELVTLVQRDKPIDPVFFAETMNSLDLALADQPDSTMRLALYQKASYVLQVLSPNAGDSTYTSELTIRLQSVATSTPTLTPTLLPTTAATATNTPTPTLTLTPLVTERVLPTDTPSPSLTPTRTLAATRNSSIPTIRPTKVVLPTLFIPSPTPFITFTPPPTFTPPSNDLRVAVTTCVTDEGVQNSLLIKLNSNQLRAFINEVAAQSGKKLSDACATQLIQLTTNLLTDPTSTPDNGNGGNNNNGIPNPPDSGRVPSVVTPCPSDSSQGHGSKGC